MKTKLYRTSLAETKQQQEAHCMGEADVRQIDSAFDRARHSQVLVEDSGGSDQRQERNSEPRNHDCWSVTRRGFVFEPVRRGVPPEATCPATDRYLADILCEEEVP